MRRRFLVLGEVRHGRVSCDGGGAGGGMVHAARLILWFLAGVALVGWIGQAWSTITPTPQYYASGIGNGYFSSKAAACTAHRLAETSYEFQCILDGTPPSEGSCRMSHSEITDCAAQVGVTIINAGDICPSNSTLSGGECVCNASYSEAGGACVTTCVAGIEKRGYVSAGSNPATVCFGGCQATVEDANNQWSVDGTPVIRGTWRSLAAACAGQPTGNAGVATASACPPGQGLGTVGGISSCYPSAPEVPSTSIQSGRVTNADGSSVTTTTETVNKGGDITTTTTSTTRDAGGSVTGVVTTAESKPRDGKENPLKEFCELYPDIPLCKAGTWTGACGAFTCDGDGIQCAQAEASWALACEATAASSQRNLGEAVAAGSDPLAGTLPEPGSPLEIPMGTLDETGWLSRSCPGDVAFTVWGGQSFVLPFGSLCSYLEAMGAVMMVVAGVGAVRVIGVGHG